MKNLWIDADRWVLTIRLQQPQSVWFNRDNATLELCYFCGVAINYVQPTRPAVTKNTQFRDQSVLFVVEEPAVREGLRRALHQAPFRCHFAESAFQALELIDSKKIDFDLHHLRLSGQRAKQKGRVPHRYPRRWYPLDRSVHGCLQGW